MRIALIAHALYPISQPYAGGLEMITHLLADALVERGHDVTLFAHADSETRAKLVPYMSRDKYETMFYDSEHEHIGMNRQDMYLYVAYQNAMSQLLAEDQTKPFDVVHNNSLHYVPMLLATSLDERVITSFHTPIFAHLRLALQILKDKPNQGRFTAVSGYQQQIYNEFVPSTVVYNGIDVDAWQANLKPIADENYVWLGRICPEKGTHLAMDMCIKAGKRLTIIGPKSNADYFETEVAPRLAKHGDLIQHIGHLTQPEINDHLKQATALLFTSTWAEPYGLVLAESLACGTPVLGFGVGAMPEIITDDVGVVVPFDTANKTFDEQVFVAGFEKIQHIDRQTCRQRAVDFCGAERMVADYLDLYQQGRSV